MIKINPITLFLVVLFNLISQHVLAEHVPEFIKPEGRIHTIAAGNGSVFVGGHFESLSNYRTTANILNIESGKIVDSPIKSDEWSFSRDVISYKNGWIVSNLVSHNQQTKLAYIGENRQVIEDWSNLLIDIPVVKIAKPQNSRLVYIISPILESRELPANSWPPFAQYRIYQLDIESKELSIAIESAKLNINLTTVKFFSNNFLFLLGRDDVGEKIYVIDLIEKEIVGKHKISDENEGSVEKFVVDENTKSIIFLMTSENNGNLPNKYFLKMNWQDGTVSPFLSNISGIIRNIYCHPSLGYLYVLGKNLKFKDSSSAPLLSISVESENLVGEFSHPKLTSAMHLAFSNKNESILVGYDYQKSNDENINYSVWVPDEMGTIIGDSVTRFSAKINNETMEVLSIIELDSEASLFDYGKIILSGNGKDVYFDPGFNKNASQLSKYIVSHDEASSKVRDWSPQSDLPDVVHKAILSKDGSELLIHGHVYDSEFTFYLIAIDTDSGAILWEKRGREFEYRYEYDNAINEHRRYDIDNNSYYRFRDKIYDLKTGDEVTIADEFHNSETVAAFSSTPSRLYFRALDQKTINVYDLEKRVALAPFDVQHDIYDIHFSESTGNLLILTKNNKLISVNSEDKSILYEIDIDLEEDEYFSILSPDDSILSVYQALRDEEPAFEWESKDQKYRIIDINTLDGSLNYQVEKNYWSDTTELIISTDSNYRYANGINWGYDIKVERRIASISDFDITNLDDFMIRIDPDGVAQWRYGNVPTYVMSDAAELSLFCKPNMVVDCASIKYQIQDPVLDFIYSPFKTYQTPIKIDKNSTVAFYSISEEGVQESNNRVQVLLDLSSPETTTDPVEGRYKDEVYVWLNCNDTEFDIYKGCKNVYYTLDGSIPDAESNPATLNINEDYAPTLSSDTVIKYYGVDFAGRKESVKTATYSIYTEDDTWYASIYILLLAFLIPAYVRIVARVIILER